jgi:hypothetical protein
VEYLYPAGGKQATTQPVAAGGKFDTWPAQAWTDSPSLRLKPTTQPGNFIAEIDKDAASGPHLVRLYTPDGPSALRIFMVGDQPEGNESEPNDELGKAQAVAALPVTINGQLEKPGDVDSFAIKLDAGQCVIASVHGRRLGAPMDPMLHLFDSAGTQLAFQHDGMGLDPLLVFRAERAGAYTIRISAFAYPPAADVKLTGAKADVYRLSLTTGSFVRSAWPAGSTRGTKSTIRLIGWNLGDSDRTASRDADAAVTGDHLFMPVPGGEGRLRLEIGDGPELMESDQDAASSPEPPPPPFAWNGRISKPGETDRVRLVVKKGEKVALSIRAAAFGSSLDAVLRVEDAAGKSLAEVDDSGPASDPRLEWTAPADGTFVAVISDRYRHGGPEYVYRLDVRKPAPDVTATLENHEYRLEPGKSSPVKVTVARKEGYSGGLIVAATSLPPGVTGSSAEVPEKGGEVALTLTAAADAKAFAAPFKVLVLSTEQNRPLARPATFALRTEAGQELIDQIDAIWLTVPPPPPATRPATQPAAK